MASELKVDKFTGVTTASSIDVTTGSVTTNLQDGMTSAWFSQMDQSGQAVDGDTLNFSSYSDPGTGRSEVTVTNIMAATNCCVIGSSQTYDFGHYQVSTSVFRYAVVNSSGTYTDGTAPGLVLGDLA